ncbi:MAG: DNA repair protein RecO [Spirochaetes bacterium]|jgi:hypothetical protein|nr:DNA repair protein RecO [Spirochaetota bacterium]
MKIVSTEGIVLSSKTVNEADVVSSLFTESDGLSRFIIKGLKKSKKRHISAADPGTRIALSFYKKNGVDTYYVHNFSVMTHIFGAITSFENSMNAHLLLELILKSSAPHMSHPYLYTMLTRALNCISETPFPFHLSLSFCVHLLKQQGILPSPVNKFIFGYHGKSETYTLSGLEHQFIQKTLCMRFDNMECNLFPIEIIKKCLFHLLLYFETYYHIEIRTKSSLFHESRVV